MIVELSNGFVFDVSDNSTIDDLMVVANNFSDLDEIRNNFTKNNFSRVKIGGNSYIERVPTNISINVGESGSVIVAHFYTRTLNSEEVIANQSAQILELQEALANIVNELIPSNENQAQEEQ